MQPQKISFQLYTWPAFICSLLSLEMVYEITIGVSFSLHYLAGQAVNEMLFGISNLIAVDK